MLFTVTSNFSFIDGIYTGNVLVFYGYFTFYMYFTGYFGTAHLKQYLFFYMHLQALIVTVLTVTVSL